MVRTAVRTMVRTAVRTAVPEHASRPVLVHVREQPFQPEIMR
jgi:hypothetical protein